MGDESPADGGAENTEYTIRRFPDLQTVSKGAKVRYLCEWKAGGRPPEVAGGKYPDARPPLTFLCALAGIPIDGTDGAIIQNGSAAASDAG